MEIEFKHVDYTYNHQLSAHNVLNDINVKFKPHKINAIIGSSGSGKTTMLEMINALLLPTKGEVQVDTYKLTSGKKIPMINNLRFDVGLVFQFPEEQFFNPTVKQEIKFGMKYFAYKLDHIDQRCSDALKLVGLDDSYLDKNPFNLSSGQKRKVAIASVLAFNPKVIILDEPTVGLDAKSKNHIKRLLRLLCNRYHKTVIIVSHDLDLVYELSDYIVLLKNIMKSML